MKVSVRATLPRNSRLHHVPLTFALILLTACSGPRLKEEQAPVEPTYAKPPASEGLLWETASGIMGKHGEDHSGFRLLDGSYAGLAARLALIDSAVSSLDIQTYLWYPDHSGRLILDRAIHAADRGVSVRLLLDDLLTIGLDQTLLELQQH